LLITIASHRLFFIFAGGVLTINTRHFFIVALAVFLLTIFFAEPALRPTRAQQANQQPLVARLTIQNREELQRLVNLGLDLLEMRDGDDYFFLTTAEQLDDLRKEGWQTKPDETQTTLLRNQQQTHTFSGGYRTVAEMGALLQSRAANFPNLADYFVYGQSWEKINSGGAAGQDLFGITLTNRSRPGPKPTLFLMAAIHARELTTSELALRLMDYLLNNYGMDGDVTWLLDEHVIVIVPAVNPDGRVKAEQGFYQRKNTNTTYGGNCANPPTSSNQYGVDLNRNSSFKWGTVNPPTEPRCGQTYPGPSAVSEPETVALQNLILSLFPDQRGANDSDPAPLTTTGTMLSLHSYSNLVLWPWGWLDNPAPNASELSLIGRKYAAYNGYTPQQATELYATSGSTGDWAYGELGICSMTFEVGPASGPCGGFFPPFTCLDGGSGGNFWLRNLPAFLYSARVAGAPYQLAQGPTPESASTVNATPASFELRAQLDEQFNGGQTISAAEYYIDTPPWRGGTAVPMNPLDGNFNSAVETATATITTSGSHLFYVRGRDANGNWGPVRGIFSPSGCSSSLAASNQSFSSAGGNGSVAVTTGSGCGWTAASNASWITISSGSDGSGNSTVNYSVVANGTGSPRSGTITIAGLTFTVLQGVDFLDVPANHPFHTEIGKLSARGVTTGCGDGNYCPEQVVTREQMAAFIIRTLGEFDPPTPPLQRFTDVPPSNPFYNFIDRLAVLQITLGCGGDSYCPTSPVMREQMAAFMIRALHEPGYLPPLPGSQRFEDVSPSNPFYAHIEEMATRGVTLGCSASPPLYCPGDTVTRAQMAAFLVRAFDL
jgi:carboxypeptidase T